MFVFYRKKEYLQQNVNLQNYYLLDSFLLSLFSFAYNLRIIKFGMNNFEKKNITLHYLDRTLYKHYIWFYCDNVAEQGRLTILLLSELSVDWWISECLFIYSLENSFGWTLHFHSWSKYSFASFKKQKRAFSVVSKLPGQRYTVSCGRGPSVMW